MVSIQRRCRSVDRRLGQGSSGVEGCLSGNGQEGGGHCGVCVFFGRFGGL